jgi:hypothetical protein
MLILLLCLRRRFDPYIICPFSWWFVHAGIWWWTREEHVKNFQKWHFDLYFRYCTCINVFERALPVWMGTGFDSVWSHFLILPYHLFSYVIHVSHPPFHIFLFFHDIQKFISHSIFVQIMWDFLWYAPCDVLVFLMIFNKFVHGKIFKMPRVCLCIPCLAPCSPFHAWNLDA